MKSLAPPLERVIDELSKLPSVSGRRRPSGSSSTCSRFRRNRRPRWRKRSWSELRERVRFCEPSASTSPTAKPVRSARTPSATAGWSASSRSRPTSWPWRGPVSTGASITCSAERSPRFATIGPDRAPSPTAHGSHPAHRAAGRWYWPPTPTSRARRPRSTFPALLAPLGLQVTRLAQGLPAGGDLEFTDDLTLQRRRSKGAGTSAETPFPGQLAPPTAADYKLAAGEPLVSRPVGNRAGGGGLHGHPRRRPPKDS